MSKWTPLALEYDPLICGSIDGTVTKIHDRAIQRASQADYHPNKNISSDSLKTIFVARLNYQTTDSTLRQIFSTFGEIKKVSLIRDLVTGFSKGYAFIEYKDLSSAKHAYDEANRLNIDGNCVLVDFELERTMKGWIPRRLGGGFGGKKESGQLRFGCRDRPFKKPIIINKNRLSNEKKDLRGPSSSRYHSHRRRERY